MGFFLIADDLVPFADIDPAKAEAMIEDAESMAALAAPCIAEAEFRLDTGLSGAVKAILRGAVIRWDEAGSGALAQETAGPFSQTVDTRQQRRGMFWPSEIEQLRNICIGYRGGATGAFSIDTAPRSGSAHLPWCSGFFGANYCSCGVDIAGTPIFEGGAP